MTQNLDLCMVRLGFKYGDVAIWVSKGYGYKQYAW